MDAEPALALNRQAPHAREPGQGVLDDLAMAAQPFAAVHAPAGNTPLDSALFLKKFCLAL